MSDLNSGPARLPSFAAADRTPSRIAGRYDLGEVIGVGAPAWVYRAEDRETGAVVAVKLYPRGYGGPDQDRRQRELGALTGLHHPNLVELLDAGDESGRAYLVMELVEGRTLGQRVLDGTMSAGDVARLGADLGYALAYLHSRGIVHRTVKPANVLLGDRPMLTDFGTAVLVDPASVSLTGSLIGTPSYLAPEQVTGATVGMAADVYALGLMLLEALTGRREYAGDGLNAAMARLSRRPSVPPDLPALSDLLHAMTATDPIVRPGAGVVSEALRTAAPELDGLSTVRLQAPGDEPRVPRISTLERLEGLDTTGRPGALRSFDRPQNGATRDDSGGVDAPAVDEESDEPDSDAARGNTDAARGDSGEPEVPAAGEDRTEPEAPATRKPAAKPWTLAARAIPVWPAGRAVRQVPVPADEVVDDEPDRPEVPAAKEETLAPDDGTPEEGFSDDGSSDDTSDDGGPDDEQPVREQPVREQPVREQPVRRPVAAGIADSGTKMLDVPPAPSGLPLPSSWAPPEKKKRREAGHRRLLAGALGVTALAAVAVGVLVSQGPDDDEPPPAQVDSGALDDAPSALPVSPAQPPPVAPVPAPGLAQPAPPPPPGAGSGSSGGGGDGGKKHKGGKKKKH